MPLKPIRLSVADVDQSPLPLDISLVKEHLAVDGNDSDGLIETLILSAVRWAEGAMRRTIYARSHTWILGDFPRDCYQKISLPRGKTQSVESIVYSYGGSSVYLEGPSGSPGGSDWQEDLRGDGGGVIMPARGSTWPSVDYDVPAPVAINFTAGWLASEVPENITTALLFAISDLFDIRGSGDLTVFGKNFDTRNLLIAPYRIKRFYE